MKITIGIPAFNEEAKIASVIVKLKKISNTIIICNDGSTDLTGSIAKELGSIVIDHSKNVGYGAAIRSIFLKAKELDVDALVTFDADGQHHVDDISRVLEPIIKNEADIVIGSRFLNHTNVPKYRKIGIKTITVLTNVSTGSKITDSQSGFRAYNKKAINDISLSDQGMGISTEILIKASKQKFKITEVPITISYDVDASTHHPVSHGASVILSTLKFVSIEHPLKFYGIPGIIFLGIGMFFLLWGLQIYSEEGRFITNISLIAIGTIITGILFIMTTVLLYTIVSVVREKTK